MLARIRKAQENEDSGFTLIELLVVMIIIGILAAIAIPAFLSQKAKAKETAVKADAANVAKDIAAATVDGNIQNLAATAGTPATNYSVAYTVVGGSAETFSAKVSSGNALAVTGPVTTATGGTGYCVSVTPATTDGGTQAAWSYDSRTGLIKAATCPAF